MADGDRLQFQFDCRDPFQAALYRAFRELPRGTRQILLVKLVREAVGDAEDVSQRLRNLIYGAPAAHRDGLEDKQKRHEDGNEPLKRPARSTPLQKPPTSEPLQRQPPSEPIERQPRRASVDLSRQDALEIKACPPILTTDAEERQS